MALTPLLCIKKEGFDEIETLHVMYDDRPIDMHGTIFILKGATEEQINQAKELFLKNSVRLKFLSLPSMVIFLNQVGIFIMTKIYQTEYTSMEY